MWNVILESGGTNNGFWISCWNFGYDHFVDGNIVGSEMKLHSYVLIGSCILTFILLACILSFKLDPAGSERFYWDLPEIEKSDPTETPQPVVAHQANQTTYMMRYSDVNGTYYLHPLEQ